MGSRDWGVLLQSKASYQNACIANNNPIPQPLFTIKKE